MGLHRSAARTTTTRCSSSASRRSSSAISATRTAIRSAATGRVRTRSTTSTVTARSRRENCPGAGCELTLGDTAVYLGSPFPSWELSFGIGHHAVQVRSRRGARRPSHRKQAAELDRGLPLLRTAHLPGGQSEHRPDVRRRRRRSRIRRPAIAAQQGTDAGYIEDGSFWKIREVSLTFSAPDHLGARLGVRGVGLTFAGRNLGTWTKYKGLDPEINENGGLQFQHRRIPQPATRSHVHGADGHSLVADDHNQSEMPSCISIATSSSVVGSGW